MRIIPLRVNSVKESAGYLKGIGVDISGVKIMAPKAILRVFKIEGISAPAANILKQHLLSLGADAALRREALVKRTKTDIIIFGTLSQLKKCIKKVRRQPFGLKEVADKLGEILKEKEPIFIARDKKVRFRTPLICGIINLTPDSFSGDGLLSKGLGNRSKITNLVLKRVEEMAKNGAKMVDLGGESTRPFSKPISEEEEKKRVIPCLRLVRKKFPSLILSIDTYKFNVAKEAVEEGVDVINDITALRHSPQIAHLVKRHHLGCILMHMKGRPQTMQINPVYKDVVKDILIFLEQRMDFCLAQGINKSQLLVDPGIGFGKRVKDNLLILNRLYEFKSLGVPVFVGVSRKSFIGKITKEEVENRLPGTLASVVISVLKGADILRVHDVKEVAQAIKITGRIINSYN